MGLEYIQWVFCIQLAKPPAHNLSGVQHPSTQHEPEDEPLSELKTSPSYLCSQAVKPATRLATRVACSEGLSWVVRALCYVLGPTGMDASCWGV
jgi:hypothetical protein